jgi:hypothetical protein
MKKMIVLSAIMLIGTSAAFAQDAEAIVRSSRDRITADTVSNRSRMVITSRNGAAQERILEQHSKKAGGITKSVVLFLNVPQNPANVRGAGFLTVKNPDGRNDQHIYLPDVGKVRRIAAEEGGESFMNSDFSNDDISSTDRSADLDTHTLLREETLDGKACYVIESRPKDRSYQYSRMIQWIDKDTKFIYKLELYDRRNENTLVKIAEMKEIKNIQGRLTATVTTMTTVAAGTSTSIYVQRLEYDRNLDDRLFTENYLVNRR